MVAWIGVEVAAQAVAFLIEVAHRLIHFLTAHSEVIIVNEVITGIVGGINIDHLHLAKVSTLQELEYLKVISFDIEVLRLVPVHTTLHDGAQRLACRLSRRTLCVLLTYPIEAEALLIAVKDLIPEELSQGLEVNLMRQLALLITHLSEG